MYKSKNLESIFIEVINTNNKNIVVGCVIVIQVWMQMNLMSIILVFSMKNFF